MGHNDHDNERPVEGSIPMPPDRDRMGRKRSWWGRPRNASPLAPDPVHNDDRTVHNDEPRLDQVTPQVEPPKRRLADDPLADTPSEAYEILGPSKVTGTPIYRCTEMIGDSQCDFTVVTPARMADHARKSTHWSNKNVLNNPTPEPEACGYRNEHGQQCLVRGTRSGVVGHIILVQKGEASHHFMPEPEATSPGVDPLSVDEAMTRRVHELIRQTQKELLRTIERADEHNINSGERTWRLNRVNELTNKLAALKLIIDSTPPVIIRPTRP